MKGENFRLRIRAPVRAEQRRRIVASYRLGTLASARSLLWAFASKNSNQLFLVRSLPTAEIAKLSQTSPKIIFCCK